MAFVKYGTLSSNSAPVLKKFIIGNSIVVTPYCSVVLSSGFIALSTSSTYFPLGHVDAIETYRGIGEITTGVAGAAIGSFLGTYTVASDNQTNAQVCALVDVSKFTLYSALNDATLGTTTGSNLAGYYIPLENSYELHEGGASTSMSNTGYVIWGVDPLHSTTNSIVSIVNSQVFN